MLVNRVIERMVLTVTLLFRFKVKLIPGTNRRGKGMLHLE